MLKYYLLLIIVVSVVRQRVCGPLDLDYNGPHGIAAEPIDPHMVAAMEEGHLIRRVRYIQRPRRNCICKAYSNPCVCIITSNPFAGK